MNLPIRDWSGNLRCQVQGCDCVIEAMTGLQEINGLIRHFHRDHLVDISMKDALELRAHWERSERSA